jgi:NADPH:quinone reductase-like Zn-dependent oxidoreductase
MADMWPSTFPSGEGSDFAGVVDEVGEGVHGFSRADDVIGFSNQRSSHADFVLVDANQLVKKPKNVSWPQAGSLFVVGTTAYAAIRAVGLKAGETLVVSGAAGGVGSVTVQLARDLGAKVIGLAGNANRRWLEQRGIVHVPYGAGAAQRIRAAASGRIDAFIDTFGAGYVDLALELGVDPKRIDTIIDFEAAKKHGVKTAGNSDAANKEVMSTLTAMLGAGKFEIPIAKVYPMANVRDAYRELERRHTHGKIVLQP